MAFSNEWEEMYKTGKHDSVWPWSEVVSLTHRYFKGDKSGLKVLELGCGAGANIPFYVSIGAHYYGLEGSITEVQKIEERFRNDNVVVKQGDFTQRIPFEEEFDLILDRSSVTHNSTEDIKNAINLAKRKLKRGGYYLGLDWFSTSYDLYSDINQKFEWIDNNTKIFYSGYFEGLGTVHFSDKEHIMELFDGWDIQELYEKVEMHAVPDEKRTASWSFVARK